MDMDKHAKLLKKIRDGNTDIRFEDLKGLCEFYFGPCRQSGSSHAVFKMPWEGDPRINIQKSKDGKAKKYQIQQVLKALDRLIKEEEGGVSK